MSRTVAFSGAVPPRSSGTSGAVPAPAGHCQAVFCAFHFPAGRFGVTVESSSSAKEANQIEKQGFGLMPSSDTILYPVAGRLYEATVKVDAPASRATPVVPNFNVRAENSQLYQALANVFTPQGRQGGAVPPGGSSSGKIYFDVVWRRSEQRRLQRRRARHPGLGALAEPRP
jgi:hypothetical protein